ncbi:hypothetical protein DSO57_1024047 [Entomophthora muscae]|uniref:Uncharacterized protein n=2 Tax=Entomophthora muscae TaxID=34485 RepID=A0ACC2RHA4_9FUNG|nr:hypothetical protein DSO57_1024046 [Entomophthora muscae]KAJ9049470.1 hypothetical protein DSO57_1024047 [Entomophthora muscae]
MNSLFLTILASIAGSYAIGSRILDSALKFQQHKDIRDQKTMFTLTTPQGETRCTTKGIKLKCKDENSTFIATHSKIFAFTENQVCVFNNSKREEIGNWPAPMVDYTCSLNLCLDLNAREVYFKPSTN